MRHNVLFRRFISALTRGEPGGLLRPIEVHAHDPLHYVGDMLACPHQISELETALCNTLWTLKDAAQKTIFDILKSRGEKLLRYPPLVPVDLSPPPAVREGVSVLLEIIET